MKVKENQIKFMTGFKKVTFNWTKPNPLGSTGYVICLKKKTFFSGSGEAEISGEEKSFYKETYILMD